MLCNHHHSPLPEHVHGPRWKPHAHEVLTPDIPPYPSPTNLHSVSTKLSILGISCIWNHIACGLCTWLLLLSVTFSRFIHVIACIYQYILPLCGWMFHSMDIVYSSIDQYLGCLHLLAIVNSIVKSIHVWFFVWTPAFISIGYDG